MDIVYTDAQIIRMTSEQVEKLGMLYPKKVYYQMETSGSPSAWTDNGEQFVGTKGSDIVRCAMEILTKHEECVDYNSRQGCGSDNCRNYSAHIRIVF